MDIILRCWMLFSAVLTPLACFNVDTPCIFMGFVPPLPPTQKKKPLEQQHTNVVNK